jgi:hypothetical protein
MEKRVNIDLILSVCVRRKVYDVKSQIRAGANVFIGACVWVLAGVHMQTLSVAKAALDVYPQHISSCTIGATKFTPIETKMETEPSEGSDSQLRGLHPRPQWATQACKAYRYRISV